MRLARRTVALQLGDAGCELVSGRDGAEFEVADARALRRLLEQKLMLNAELRKAFLAGLEDALGEPETLHAALRPMTVTNPARAAGRARCLLDPLP